MAENEVPKKPDSPGAPAYDAGHVPITEEFDSAKRTLPPVAPVAIALVVVAIVVAIIAYTERAKPVVQGGINAVYFSQPAGMSSVPDDSDGCDAAKCGAPTTLYIKSIAANLEDRPGRPEI